MCQQVLSVVSIRERADFDPGLLMKSFVYYIFSFFITNKYTIITQKYISPQYLCVIHTATCFDTFMSSSVHSQCHATFFKLQLLEIKFINQAVSPEALDCSCLNHNFIKLLKC